MFPLPLVIFVVVTRMSVMSNLNKSVRLSSGQYISHDNHYQTKDNNYDPLADIDPDKNILHNLNSFVNDTKYYTINCFNQSLKSKSKSLYFI